MSQHCVWKKKKTQHNTTQHTHIQEENLYTSMKASSVCLSQYLGQMLVIRECCWDTYPLVVVPSFPSTFLSYFSHSSSLFSEKKMDIPSIFIVTYQRHPGKEQRTDKRTKRKKKEKLLIWCQLQLEPKKQRSSTERGVRRKRLKVSCWHRTGEANGGMEKHRCQLLVKSPFKYLLNMSVCKDTI